MLSPIAHALKGNFVSAELALVLLIGLNDRLLKIVIRFRLFERSASDRALVPFEFTN